jgi:hypothetical protein
LVVPNIVDYFTKPPPNPRPFPSAPGKIPSNDNPYAGPALIEAAAFLPSLLEGGLLVPLARGGAGIAEDVAPATIARISGAAGSNPLAAPILDRAALLRLNAALGRSGEEAVGIPANAPKSGITVAESGTTRYPDRLTRTTIEEVKNVKYQALTQQLRDYLAHAQNNDLTFILHVRPDTKYSSPLRLLIESGQIDLRYIPRVLK